MLVRRNTLRVDPIGMAKIVKVASETLNTPIGMVKIVKLFARNIPVRVVKITTLVSKNHAIVRPYQYNVLFH